MLLMSPLSYKTLSGLGASLRITKQTIRVQFSSQSWFFSLSFKDIDLQRPPVESLNALDVSTLLQDPCGLGESLRTTKQTARVQFPSQSLSYSLPSKDIDDQQPPVECLKHLGCLHSPKGLSVAQGNHSGPPCVRPGFKFHLSYCFFFIEFF